MSKLPNEKHEAFAHGVAKGMSNAEAYVYAGYNHSPGAASRLGHKPEVVERIKFLKEKMMSAAKALVTRPSPETAEAFAAHGVDIDWCITQWKEIAEEARNANQFAPANAAVKHIKDAIDIKSAKDPKESQEEEKFTLRQIENISKLVGALQLDDATPDIVDITPPEEPLVEVSDLITVELDDNSD